MIRKSFALILFVLIGASVGYSQTPEPKQEKELTSRLFSFSLDGAGGYLGVQAEDVSKDNFNKFGLREVKGVGVESVVDGSPAQAAGLQKSDVILKLNGEEVTSARKLTRLVSEIAPDHQARLTVLRNGAEREVIVTVGKRPGMSSLASGPPQWSESIDGIELPNMPNLKNLPRIERRLAVPGAPGAPMVRSFSSNRQIGVGVMPMSKQLADHFGVQSGVLVNNVREDSAAAKAGIKAGDIIIEVDGKAVSGDFDLIRAIAEKKEGSLNLTIVRDRSRQTISVTPEEAKGGFENIFEYSTPAIPEAPNVPDVFRMIRPAAPGTPTPLNRLFIPGLVI